MPPKTQPMSEESKGPSASTDTKNRTVFDTRKNLIVMVFLFALVANSIVSNIYSSMLNYAPDSTSPQKEMTESIMALERMKQFDDANITAKETVPKKVVEALTCTDNTTVIITSNFIPISPSLAMMKRTIQSLHHLRGLCPTSPLIITVDGVDPRLRSKHNNTDERHAQYIQALKDTYNQDHHTIVASNRSVYLTQCVRNAINQVKTEFVYVIQHDMPFVQDINHAAILKTMMNTLMSFDSFGSISRITLGVPIWSSTLHAIIRPPQSMLSMG
jgi:hypothetical protein